MEVSWTLTKKTLICGSRRDQEDGGELDSHEEESFAGPGEIKKMEVSWTLTKKTLICGSRRDQEDGGELDSHEEDSFAGPGEIKRREVTLKKTLICEDQEDVGLSRRRLSFAGPGEIKRREVSWALTKKFDSHFRVQARSRGGR